MEPILDFAHAKTTVLWYAFLGLAMLNCNCALDMWWLGLGVFVVCIIEVSIRVVDVTQPCDAKGNISVLA